MVHRPSRFGFLRSRNALIAVIAALAVTASAIGFYLVLRPQSRPAATGTATPLATVAAPSVPAVGVQTVSKTDKVDVLTVVATSPTGGAMALLPTPRSI